MTNIKHKITSITVTMVLSVVLLLSITSNVYANSDSNKDLFEDGQSNLDPKDDVSNNDKSFDIKSFGVTKDGNPYMTLYGTAGKTIPDEEGIFYAYAFVTDDGIYVVTSHELQDEHSGENDGALDWHGHKVTLDDNSCVTSLADDGKAVIGKKDVTVIGSGAFEVYSVLTAELQAHDGQVCVTEVFDDSSNTKTKEKPQPGVLIYTHGFPNNPDAFRPDMAKLTFMENAIEQKLNVPAEKITHMPYTWDYGLLALDRDDTNYAIFLYTDLFGPRSTVIHNVTRGMFGGIDAYEYCPGVMFDESNIPPPAQDHSGIGMTVEQYGPVCSYMGQITVAAEKFSNSKVIFAEPARPDHPILREMFVKQAKIVSNDASKEILVLVGHGAKANSNDNSQKSELSCAANYVKKKMGFDGAIGITAREDWPDLMPVAVAGAVEQIKTLMQSTGAEKVVLIPVSGAGHGFEMVTHMLDEEGIEHVVSPETMPIGKQEYTKWAEQTVKDTIRFIEKTKPTSSTITPQWDKNYSCN